jgi:hypothetical protein
MRAPTLPRSVVTFPAAATLVFALAGFASCNKSDQAAGPTTCCDQPKIPAGVAGFTVVRDEVTGPTDGQDVKLHVARETHVLRATLADTERRLRSSGFVRIHRSRLVNWARVREFVADADHDPQVVLQNGVKVPASASYLRELQQKLASLR